MPMESVIVSILAVVVLLTLVSLLLPWAERRSIPSTLVLACLGIAFGAIALVARPDWEYGLVSDVVVGLRDIGISPQIFLYLFLPPLLFTAGLAIDANSRDLFPVDRR